MSTPGPQFGNDYIKDTAAVETAAAYDRDFLA
jgi:hypothetical protein